ncbi:MAG: OmpA family protein [Deltaproteobacteria bacterium]|nr:OmpA family protein [Deltaproteobacteria bacterium]
MVATASASFAQSPEAERLGVRIRERVELGREMAAILVQPTEDVLRVRVTVSTGDRTVKKFTKAVKAGTPVEFSWKPPAGRIDYQADFDIKFANGDKGNFKMEFTVAAQPPLRVQILRSELDLEKRRLVFTQSRPAAKTELLVWAKSGGDPVQKKEIEWKGDPLTKLEIIWDALDGELGRLAVKTYDADGFWAGVEVEPFTVEIPHDEVEFESGSDVIRKNEAPKLEKSYALLRDALEKHKDDIEMKLFIAGYTDTVGGVDYNMGLSERRARSIARWFKKRIRIPVYYQGFGKSVLAVVTPDQTPEPKNRRALYVLTNMPPVTSTAIPRQYWKAAR